MSSHTTAAFTEVAEVQPAAGVWQGPDPTDLNEQAEQFRKLGFVILRSVLSPAEIDQLKRELHRLALEHENLPRIREGFDLEPDQDGSRPTPTFRKIGGIADLSDPFNHLLEHPRILEVLHEVMGPTVQLWRDVCMMKPARVGREKPWHQDSSYWPWEPMSLVSAMTALDEATPANGCLQVIPETHHDALQHYGKELQVDIEGDLLKKTLYVPLKPGDTLLFHSLLLHASEPNRSNDDRRVCIFSYKSPQVSYIGKGDEPERRIVSQR